MIVRLDEPRVDEIDVTQDPLPERCHWLATMLRPKFAIPALLCFLLVSSPLLYRGYRLAGVYDPGEPFDVAEFMAYSVPSDDNAFVEYRRACSLLATEPTFDPGEWETAVDQGWGAASERIRRWIGDNRAALQEWKRGTVKSRSLFMEPRRVNIVWSRSVILQLRTIARLVKIDTSRLEAEGRLDEAWEWHRALFRSSRHCGQYGTQHERFIGVCNHEIAADGIARWSKVPELSAAQLKRAIKQLQSDYELTSLTSNNFKMEYVMWVNSAAIDFPDLLGIVGEPVKLGRLGSWSSGEPELFQMSLNLELENWLSQVDKPLANRAPLLDVGRHGFYQRAGAGSTVGGAYVATADEIERALSRSLLWRRSGRIYYLDEYVLVEQARQHSLLFALAVQAYQRDYGEFPAAADDIVGEYLRQLPADPFGQSGDRIQYRREANGFTVWSRGPNQLDDGGRNDDRETGDILVRFSRAED